MRPLLDSFFGYNQIKENGVNAHKITVITNCGTMNYKCMLSSLHDASTTFKRLIQTTLEELISIHIYLDDVIVYVKGMTITSVFQVLFLGPFKINFFLCTNSYILRDLREQLFSYSINSSHFKHYVGPT
jgi:hypothetical protein